MAKKPATKKSTTKAKPAAKKLAAVASQPHVNVGTVIFAVVILLIGLLGWYILDASQAVNDEYNEADQANSTILKDSSADSPQ